MSLPQEKLPEIDPRQLAAVDCWYWCHANQLSLGGKPYSLAGHEYQVDWLQCDAQRQCFKKGAQMGATETNVLKTLHGHVAGRYPQGTLYLFPTRDDVSDFSKGRFSPLISENHEAIGRFVTDTDANNIKRVGGSFLYFRGARATAKIEGIKSSSSQLKSVPVDRVVYDEKDEMDPHMVTLALERMSHSSIQEEVSISTPTIPGYGVDVDYEVSDQRVRMLKCQKCNTETCLELEFPKCLIETREGTKRVCRKCGSEIFPKDGQWVAQYPGRDSVGWWISQLNSIFVDPGKILRMFRDPPNGNITEVYNSKLGMAHIEATNRLSRQDVYACCSSDAIERKSSRSCAMGVDIGKVIHVVIGHPVGEKKYQILYVGRVSEFSDVHDLAQDFNVKSAVIDMEPEIRKAREFQRAEPYKVYLCDYAENQKVEKREDDVAGLVVVRRTEVCDASHGLISQQAVILPRRCSEVEEYAKEMCNIAKVLQVDDVSGSQKYLYRNLGADHYRHATNYFMLACNDYVVQSANDPKRQPGGQQVGKDWSPHDYN